MSNVIMCDGPNCREIAQPRSLRAGGFTKVVTNQIFSSQTRHFHAMKCLAEWSAAQLTKDDDQ